MAVNLELNRRESSKLPFAAEPGRLAYIDNLRFFAVLLLIVFHAGMLFSFRTWYLNNAQRSKEITYSLFFSGNFRLTLLFFASGYLARHLIQRMPFENYLKRHLKFSAAALLTGVLLINPLQIFLENTANPGRIPLAFALYPKGLVSLHHLWFVAYLWLCVFTLYFIHRYARSIMRLMERYPFTFISFLLLLVATMQAARGFTITDARDTLGSWSGVFVYFVHFTCGFAMCMSRFDRVFSWPAIFALLGAAVALNGAYGYLRLFTVHHDAAWLPFLSQGAKAVSNAALLMLFIRLAARRPDSESSYQLHSARRQTWFLYFWHQPLILIWGLKVLPLGLPIHAKLAAVVVLTAASLYLLWRAAMLLPSGLRPFVACK